MDYLSQLSKEELENAQDPAELPDNEAMIERIDHSISDLEKQPVASLRGRALHNYIDELQIDFADIHQQLAEQYFLH